MPENCFEILRSINNGSTWIIVKDDVVGWFPIAKQLFNGVILIFYISEGAVADYDLSLMKSFTNGVTWESAEVIVSDVIRGQVGLEQLHSGHIVVTFWKDVSGTDTTMKMVSLDSGVTWETPEELDIET